MHYSKEQTVWLTNPEEYVKGAPEELWVDNQGLDMKSQGWLNVAEVDVTVAFDLPSRDAMRGIAVEKLQEAIREVDAQAYSAKTRLEQRIQNLLAIAHDPGEVEVVFVVSEDDDILF